MHPSSVPLPWKGTRLRDFVLADQWLETPNAPNADHTESAMFRPDPWAVNPPLREPMGWPPFPVPSCVILVDCGMEITCCDSPSCRLRQLERPERRAANHDPEVIDDPERRWSTEQGNGQQTQDSAHVALPCVALRCVELSSAAPSSY